VLTDREKAFAIYGYVRFAARKDRLSEHQAKALGSLAAQRAQIPFDLVLRVSAESDTLGRIMAKTRGWPVIGLWLVRRSVRRAYARGAISMSDREKAINLDANVRIVEWSKKLSHPATAERLSAWAARILQVEPQLVAQLSGESTSFIKELSAAVETESHVST
jgi:hypothetical protein